MRNMRHGRPIAALAVAAAAVVAGPVGAADAPLQVSYPTDGSMDCAAIAGESVRMDQLIAQANGQISSADGGQRGAGLAGTLATEGLARSGALARVPGLGMVANQAQSMARQRAESQKAQAAGLIQTATTRKALLAGLYAGKRCDAPPAESSPAPAPAGT